jgi:N-acetylneuraminic acid mutarotase
MLGLVMKHFKNVMLGLLLLAAACGAPAAEPPPAEPPPAEPEPGPLQWTRGADAPQRLFEAQGVAVDGKLYVFGGFYRWLDTTLQAHAYDPANDTWARLADVPEKLTHAGNAVFGEEVYLAGGFVDYGSTTNEVWIYDVAADAWSEGPPLPEDRGAGALVALDGRLHYFGGTVREGRTYAVDAGDHWILDPGEEAWTPAAPLPNPRNHIGGVVLDGKIYAIGGQHLGDDAGGNQRDVHVYDPATDTWTEVAPLPYPLSHITVSTFIWDGRIIVVGGLTQERRELATIIAYDPESDAWSEIGRLPAPRQTAVSALFGDTLVVTTGYADGGPQATTWLGRREP